MGRRLLALAIVLLVPTLAGSATASPGEPTNGRLLLATGPRLQYSLETLDLRSHERHTVVPFGGFAHGEYSADGTKIAFMTNYDGDLEICVINADGTGVRQVTKNSWADAYPTWSPDGTKLAFTSNRDGDFDIYIMNADGTNPVNVTNDSRGAEDDPHWSPDGTRIAFNSDHYGQWDVWEYRLAQNRIFPLVWTFAPEWFDSWSPDSSQFLVESSRGGDLDLFSVVTPPLDQMWEVGAAQLLADDAAMQGSAQWSPDGRQIAYSGNRDGDWEVYVIDADGSNERQVTHNRVDDFVDDWQSLHDVAAPTSRALPSTVRPGHRGMLRFRSADDSGKTSVWAVVYDAKRIVGYDVTQQQTRTRNRTYSLPWRAPKVVSNRLRFCIEAYDASGNESAESCAAIRVVR